MRPKPVQENLERGSEAIKRGTIEINPWKRGWLVRWKTISGYANRKRFPGTAEGRDQAFELFNQKVRELRDQIQRRKGAA